MNRFNIITVSLLILISGLLVWVAISVHNLEMKIDRNQERILNNQNSLYQIVNK